MSTAVATRLIPADRDPHGNIDLRPPKGVRRAATLALQKIAENPNLGFSPGGPARTRALASGQPATPQLIRDICANGQRHRTAALTADRDAHAFVAWLSWGGQPGYDWATRTAAALEAADLDARLAAFDEGKVTRWPKGTEVDETGAGGGRFAPKQQEPEPTPEEQALYDLVRVQDTARTIRTATYFAGRPDGYDRSEVLSAMYDEQGFHGKPRIVTPDEFDRLAASGDFYYAERGTGSHVNDYQTAEDHRAGRGVHGDGTYVAIQNPNIEIPTQTPEAILAEGRAVIRAVVGGYGAEDKITGPDGTKIGAPDAGGFRLLIPKDRLANGSEIKKAAEAANASFAWYKTDPEGGRAALAEYTDLSPAAKRDAETLLNAAYEVGDPEATYEVLSDLGRIATALGYDGYSVREMTANGDHVTYGVILNRAATITDGTTFHWAGTRDDEWGTPSIINWETREIPGVVRTGAFTAGYDTRWPKGTRVEPDGRGGGRFAPRTEDTPADITVRPGTAADWEGTRQQAQVTAAIRELEEHFQLPVEVKFGRESFTADHGIEPGANSYACVRTGTNQIYLLAHPDGHGGRRDTHQATDWVETATHEFGHALDHTLGSPSAAIERERLANISDARAAARTAWNNSLTENGAIRGALREMGVTRYALKNDREFYAEMFTAWWRQGGGDKPGNVRSAFLRQFAKNMGWTTGTPAPMETVLNSRRRRYEALLMGADGTRVTKVIAAPTVDPDDGNLVPLAEGFFFDGPNLADAIFLPAGSTQTAAFEAAESRWVLVPVTAAYDETKHARWPKGTQVNERGEGGGRFAPKSRKLQPSPEKLAEAERTAARWEAKLAGELTDEQRAKAEYEATYWRAKAGRIRDALGTEPPAPPVEPPVGPEPEPAPTPDPEPEPAPQPTTDGQVASFADWDKPFEPPLGWEGEVTTLSGGEMHTSRRRRVREASGEDSGWEYLYPASGSRPAQWQTIYIGPKAWGTEGAWTRTPVVGGVDPGWRAPEHTVAALEAQNLDLNTLLPPGDAKAFIKAVKTEQLTIGPAAADGKSGEYSQGDPKPAHAIVYKGRINAMNALGTGLGYTPEQTAAALAANDKAWNAWAMAGGHDPVRAELEAAMQHLREGGTAETDLQRGLLIQRGYTQAVLRARGETEVGITRFIQGEYAAALILERDAGRESIDAWPLTSWATPKAGAGVMNRFIGKDGYAVQMTGTTPADAVWLTYHGEPLFRTSQLKAPGEIVVDDRNELRFADLQTEEWVGDEIIQRRSKTRAAEAIAAAPDENWLSPALSQAAYSDPAPVGLHLLGVTDGEELAPPDDPYGERINQYTWHSHLPEGWKTTTDSGYGGDLINPAGEAVKYYEPAARDARRIAEDNAKAALAAARRRNLQAAKDLGYSPIDTMTGIDRASRMIDSINNDAEARRGKWTYREQSQAGADRPAGTYRYQISDWDREEIEKLNEMRRSVGLDPINTVEFADRYPRGERGWGTVFFDTEEEAHAAWLESEAKAAEIRERYRRK